ncbi:MAG: hypothetical protein N2316_02720 [Spirochaetes bacterium]|nr:hypothetical protein [Spirochaetota bacterium]
MYYNFLKRERNVWYKLFIFFSIIAIVNILFNNGKTGCVRISNNALLAQNVEKEKETEKKIEKIVPLIEEQKSKGLIEEKKEEKSESTAPKIVIEIDEKGEKEKGKKVAQKEDKKTAIKGVLLNFNNAELSEILSTLGNVTKKNIIIDDRVRGKISISSNKKIPVESLMDILRTVLELRGFAMVETEHYIKIVPIKDAIQGSFKIVDDDMRLKVPGGEIVTYLQQFQNADVKEVKNVIQSLKSKDSDLIVYQPENMLIYRGPADEVNSLVAIGKSLDKAIQEISEEILPGEKEKKPTGKIHVVHLENADASELASVLSRVPFSETALIDTTPLPESTVQPKKKTGAKIKEVKETTTQAKAAQPKGKLSIIANKETNSLIIAASPEEFTEIKRVINELDIVREQVYIESLIVEVSADSGWGFGIDWMLGNQWGSHIVGTSNITGSIPNFTVPSGLTGKTLAVPLGTGFQLGYLADKSILAYALLNASASDRNFNILSTPQVLAIDNNESEINVGEEIPVPTNNRISDTGTQFYTFEYKSVGVKLKCKPHITNKASITLDLFLEVNSVLGETTVLEKGGVIPPKLGRRDFKTKVTVADGKTIVVGGLIRNSKSRTESYIPILGDIPLIGNLFKRISVSDNKTNLLVFITPYIVTKQEKLDTLTDQKKEQQRRLKFLRK